MNIQTLAAISKDRPVYCWGAGRYGVMAGDALLRAGVRVAGFIDKAVRPSSRDDAIKILHPDALDHRDGWLVVVTSMFFEGEIERSLLSKGYVIGRDYALYSALKKWSFEIDVSGVCQLKCPSCPNGNFSGGTLAKDMMGLDLYRRILSKLLAEVDFLPDVQLYSWGEPLLNPALPDMVAYSVERGVSVGISSNLNDTRHLEKTILARPDWFRVSLSGTGERYGLSHRGGRWEKVARHIDQLAELRGRHHPGMVVEMNYHLYRHNAADVETIAALCRDKGFLFKPNAAYIDPLDTLIEYVEGQPLPDDLVRISRELLLDVDEVLRDCRRNRSANCVRERTVVIHSDGAVRQCPHVFGAQYRLDRGLLDSSMGEISRLFADRDLCRRCKSLGLNNFYAHFLDCSDQPGAEMPRRTRQD
ncbi:radical SAM protein [Thiorhodococcus minor]|uniref:Radical SAM protein n=1 Tax=Thiorhodococcus minor TaxID=57489 RepID=A0A6M0JSP5_9GAMM|nr:hypothetical protein [Thiorhodococcus minor]NEV60548.1 hypothetical protein [Thiorhodococcus minor]